jgi:hypothetical protein
MAAPGGISFSLMGGLKLFGPVSNSTVLIPISLKSYECQMLHYHYGISQEKSGSVATIPGSGERNDARAMGIKQEKEDRKKKATTKALKIKGKIICSPS